MSGPVEQTGEGGALPSDRATHEQSPQVVSAVPVGIPSAIAKHVLRMGKVDWGATAPKSDEDHLEDFRGSLAKTREHFSTEGPQRLHGLYLEGTETVLCHTGTSPNSGENARVLAGVWNQLVDLCAAQSEQPS